MLHLDLFSGIGGFAYAADQVWDDVEHIFCDNDKFCQQVLKKHWPESLIYDDIKTITNTERKGWGQRHIAKEGQAARRDNRIDLLTGGFPCQPFSAAGVRRGTSDERYLWPEMLRVIRLTKPTWVIAENVRGLATWEQGLVLQQVCLDLETEGYEVQPIIIPAVAVNAPHRRERVWFIAHASSSPSREKVGEVNGKEDGISPKDRAKRSRARKPSRATGLGQQRSGDRLQDKEIVENRNAANTTSNQNNSTEPKGFYPKSGLPNWRANWLEVATHASRVDDGLPNRVDRLKSLGNAIVPQVAIEIMKGINL